MVIWVLPLLLLGAVWPGCFGQSTTPSSVNRSYTHTILPTDYEDGAPQPQEILRSPNGTFQLQFGTLPGQSNPHGLGIVHLPSTTLVWYTYRGNNPGGYDNLGGNSTTLALTQDGNLAITVEGNNVNVLVWNSGTSGRGVESMEMREEGNLVLLNSSKGIVWQSFDHPTDTLLQNQRLLLGGSLLARARNDYPSLGTTLMRLESRRLVTYAVYVDAEPYWQLESPDGRELAYATIVNASIAVFDQNGNMVAASGNLTTISTGLQRFLLDVDGNMRLSTYDNTSSSWIAQFQVIQEACALPDDCGYYGLCVPGQACSCPPTFSLLATLNGCVPPRALQCNSHYSNDFVKVPYASYFALPLASPPNLTFQACQNLCTGNCSCLGFFFAVDGGSTRPCFITHQMRTFSASAYGNYTQKYGYDLYVRVQGTPRSPLVIILGVCIPVVVILFCVLLWWFVRNRVKVAHAEEEEFLLEALPGLPPRYSYRELRSVTKNFSQKLGGGSFGSVYEGELGDGSKVAVKQLEGAMQGKKEFHAEVATIGMVRHLNLVRLRGFCLERNHRLLVYEHMDKGSLDMFLFKGKEKLSWHQKMEVALGVARGLAYLHEGSPDCIIHCDVKPENILVDADGVAKLSDFGLAKLMSRQHAWVETIVRGTRGYLAPEWLMGRARISDKADVYSYGVVLLEILAGRRNYECSDDETRGSYLPEWALRRLGEEVGVPYEGLHFQWLLEAVPEGAATTPPSATKDTVDIEAQKRRAVLIALWCVQDDPALRPSMSRVVRMLEGDVDVVVPPTPSPMSADAPSSFTSSINVERQAASEVTLPFLHRASRFLFASPAPPRTRAPATSL